MIHVYCGDGKGKTTCAFGLALRAIGRNMNVVVAQFLKGSATGEVIEIEKIDGVRVFRLDKEIPFTYAMSEDDKKYVYKAHNRIFQKALQFVSMGYCDMLILDELCSALETGLIDNVQIESFLKSVTDCEVIITGRNPPQYILDIADYVTEMTEKKHPFSKGVDAREGIEY